MKFESWAGTDEVGKLSRDLMSRVRVSQYSRLAGCGRVQPVRQDGPSHRPKAWHERQRFIGKAGSPLRQCYNKFAAIEKRLAIQRRVKKKKPCHAMRVGKAIEEFVQIAVRYQVQFDKSACWLTILDSWHCEGWVTASDKARLVGLIKTAVPCEIEALT